MSASIPQSQPESSAKNELINELLRTPSEEFDTFNPPADSAYVHMEQDAQELLGESPTGALDAPAPTVHSARDVQIIQTTLASAQAAREQQRQAPLVPGEPSGIKAAQRALESPGFEGVRPAAQHPASVINLVTRGRMPAGERLREYLKDLSASERDALRAFMDDYKMNADSPEIVTAMLMGHIVKVAHVIPNQIDLQVERTADQIHAAMAAYASVPKNIDTHIGVFKEQSAESALQLRAELEEFAEAFHEKMREDLTGVMNDYFDNLDRLEALIAKHKQLLEDQANIIVQQSTNRLQESERALEARFKKEIGGALLSATQSLNDLAKQKRAPVWVPYAVAAASFGALVGALLVALIK